MAEGLQIPTDNRNIITVRKAILLPVLIRIEVVRRITAPGRGIIVTITVIHLAGVQHLPTLHHKTQIAAEQREIVVQAVMAEAEAETE